MPIYIYIYLYIWSHIYVLEKETIASPQASLISCIDLFFVLKLHVVLVVVSPTVAVLGATVFCRGPRRVWKVPGIHMACHFAVEATT